MADAEQQPTPMLCELVDLHQLYESAVYNMPEESLHQFTEVYRQHRGSKPARTIREDFCGTAALCRAWAQQGPEYLATGVDFSEEVLQWARARAATGLSSGGWSMGASGSSGRITLLHEDVLHATSKLQKNHDIIIANNFSYLVFKKPTELLGYFTSVCEGLNEGGMFTLDLYGGEGAMSQSYEDMGQSQFRRLDSGRVMNFHSTWEQAAYDPATADTLCHIHFHFPDGSELRQAFTYDWRLWTLDEVRSTLHDAGFASVISHFEDLDEDGEMNGTFVERDEPVYSDECDWFRAQLYAFK